MPRVDSRPCVNVDSPFFKWNVQSRGLECVWFSGCLKQMKGPWGSLYEIVGHLAHAAAAKSLQSCLTLCDPIDGSPLGSSDPGILQARTLERVAISFSNAWKWKVKVKSLSRVRLLATPWTAAYQAPPSMGFSRQKYWSAHSDVETKNQQRAWVFCNMFICYPCSSFCTLLSFIVWYHLLSFSVTMPELKGALIDYALIYRIFYC